VLDDRSVKCWGWNHRGQLGYGDTWVRTATIVYGDNRPEETKGTLPAVALGTGRTAVSIAAGYDYTCALLDDRSVKCWGWNDYHQLGYGDRIRRGDGAGEMGDTLPAVALGTGRTAVSIAAGEHHTCAVLDDRSVKCWGWNYFGWLGYGDTIRRGDGAGEMGDALPAVSVGGVIARLPSSRSATNCTCVFGYTAEADGVACRACGAGTYKPVTGSGSCSPCAAGTYSGEGATSCTPCEAGTFSPSQGAGACLACPAHTSSTVVGSSALTDCTCIAGYTAEADGLACRACGAGTYKLATGSGSCSPCAAGTYAPVAGIISIKIDLCLRITEPPCDGVARRRGGELLRVSCGQVLGNIGGIGVQSGACSNCRALRGALN